MKGCLAHFFIGFVGDGYFVSSFGSSSFDYFASCDCFYACSVAVLAVSLYSWGLECSAAFLLFETAVTVPNARAVCNCRFWWSSALCGYRSFVKSQGLLVSSKDWPKFNMWVNYSILWGIHIIAAALTIPSQNESAPSGLPQSPFIYSWNRNNSWE